jgi:hypothetical protein
VEKIEKVPSLKKAVEIRKRIKEFYERDKTNSLIKS